MASVGEPMTPTAANEVLGLPKPTVHRLFHRLEQEGFLQRDIDGRSYSAGQRLRKMAVNVMSSSRARAVRLAVLNALAADVGETCNIAMPDREGMIYLDRVETKWPLRIQFPVGTTVPFHCTASGKMYLASLAPRLLTKLLSASVLVQHTDKTLTDSKDLQEELDIVRRRGFSTDNEEFMDGMVALAVPVSDDHGRLIATLSVHAPDQRGNVQELQKHLERLQAAATDLSDLMVR